MPRELVSTAVLNSADAWRRARRTTQRTNLCFYPVIADEMAPLSYLLAIVLCLNNDPDRSMSNVGSVEFVEYTPEESQILLFCCFSIFALLQKFDVISPKDLNKEVSNFKNYKQNDDQIHFTHTASITASVTNIYQLKLKILL